MINYNRILKYVKHPSKFFLKLDEKGILRLPDKIFIKFQFYNEMGYKLDLKNPITFDEKLQWLKLYDRNPLYTTMVDKYEAKEYVGKIIGEKHIIPTIGIYDKWEDIDFKKLPKSYVIKTTHDSGSVFVIKDGKIDKEMIKEKIEKSLKNNFFYQSREWPYKNVKPRILIEKYMEDNVDKELRDYKLYSFDGYVAATLLATNRQSKTEELNFDYFNDKFKHLKWTNEWHPNNKKVPHKPVNYELMRTFAEKLSKGFPHMRVDFYEVNGEVYFGEITLYDMAGYLKIHPDKWETRFGKLIKLPKKRK